MTKSTQHPKVHHTETPPKKEPESLAILSKPPETSSVQNQNPKENPPGKLSRLSCHHFETLISIDFRASDMLIGLMPRYRGPFRMIYLLSHVKVRIVGDRRVSQLTSFYPRLLVAKFPRRNVPTARFNGIPRNGSCPRREQIREPAEKERSRRKAME